MTPGPPPSGSAVNQQQVQAIQAAMQQQAVLKQLQGKAQELQGELTVLQEANKAEFRQMQLQGLGIDPVQVIHLRISMLIEKIALSLGPQGLLWGLEANLSYEKRMAEVLEEVKGEGAKAQLSVGGALSAEQIRLLAKSTGTFGG
jgi:hypothetical protein